MPSDTEKRKEWWEHPEWKVLGLSVALMAAVVGWVGNELLQGVRNAESSVADMRERVRSIETAMEKRTDRLESVERNQVEIRERLSSLEGRNHHKHDFTWPGVP